MNRRGIFLGILAVLILISVGIAQSYETNLNQLVLEESAGGENPYLLFEASDGTDIAKLMASDADANAECLIIDLPAGGAVVVPVVLLTLTDSNFGYFNGQTQPALAIEDADGDSWIRISFSADDTPAISVGGVASAITIPGVSGYSWTDDVSIDMGTGTDVAIEFTTDDANANCLLVDLPTGSATSVPAFVVASADSDFGYFNGIVEPTFAVENLAGTGYVGLDFSGTTLSRLITGGATTQLSVISPLVYFGIDGTGEDVTFYGDTASYKVWWDYNGDTNGAWYFGADDYGVDVVFYGQTVTNSVTWDASADSMLFGADAEGVDVKMFGTTTGDYMLFDESIDTLVGVDLNVKLDDDAILYFGTGTNVTTADGDFTVNFTDGAPGILTITAVANDDALQIGDGTIGTDLIIQNTTTAGADITWDDSTEIFAFGVDNTGVDVEFFGDGTGNYLYFDESIDAIVAVDIDLKIDDDAVIFVGTGTNVTTADGDFKIESVSDTRMDITSTAANGIVAIGDGAVATDFLIDNITVAGADVWFDASADTANGVFYFGANDIGIDVQFFGATASQGVTWDYSTDTWFFGADAEGVDVHYYGDTTLYQVWWDENADTNGTWYFGDDDYGVDVVFSGVTSGKFAKWDASADDLLVGTSANYVKLDETGVAMLGTAGALTSVTSGIAVTTNTTKTHKYSYTGLGYISATAVEVINGTGLTCVGLEGGGAGELGATEGYVGVGDAADYLIFTIPIPADFYDGGAATDLVLDFDIDEQAAEECNIDVRIFEYGNTTPIITDALAVANDNTRDWKGLVTLSTGIGADADITADDNYLVIELTSTADADNFNIYGVRLKYNVGIEATQ